MPTSRDCYISRFGPANIRLSRSTSIASSWPDTAILCSDVPVRINCSIRARIRVSSSSDIVDKDPAISFLLRLNANEFALASNVAAAQLVLGRPAAADVEKRHRSLDRGAGTMENRADKDRNPDRPSVVSIKTNFGFLALLECVVQESHHR